MANNLNLEVKLAGCDSAQEFRTRTTDSMAPVFEEVTVMKTEVMEESSDFQTANKMEFVNVKEEPETFEYVSSPTDNFEENNLGPTQSTVCLNEAFDEWKGKYENGECPESSYGWDPCRSEFGAARDSLNHSRLYPFENKELTDKMNRDQEIFVCSFCKLQVFNEVAYRQHVRCCKWNDLSFRRNVAVKGHINRKQFSSTIYNCVTCGHISMSDRALKKHMLAKHSDMPGRFKCEICEYSARMKRNLIIHMRRHTNDKPFKCTYKNCKCSGQEPCECDTCDYAAVQKGHLKTHILLKHSGETKKYICTDCQYSTHSKSHLKNHILLKHSGEAKKYKCEDCQYSTHTKGDLTVHMRIHTNERPFKCTYKNCKCVEEESCECDTCDYASAQSSSLKTHILTKHSRETKRYKCKDCDYSAHIKKYLVNHMRTHTNEKPYKCTYKNCKCDLEESCACDPCSYSASRKGILKMHILTKHSGERKRYECENCEFSTHRKASLVVHIRIHSNEKPFRCTYKNCKCSQEFCGCAICGFATARRYSLKRHILLKHVGERRRSADEKIANIPFKHEEI